MVKGKSYTHHLQFRSPVRGEAGFFCHYLFLINMWKTTASCAGLLIPHGCHHGDLVFYVQLNVS